MTLKYLCKNVEVQSNIRISIWDYMGEEEVEVHEFQYVDNLIARLNSMEGGKRLLNLEVKFLFAPGDGYLHIELDNPESR